MFNVEVTVAGVTQFSPATPVCTFLEDQDPTLLPPDVAPRILWYAYDQADDDLTEVTVVLAPSTGQDANFSIQLENPIPAVNFIFVNFGRTGLIVPRLFGLVNSGSQAPDTAVGSPNNAAPYVMLVTTAAKDDDATFRVGWDYVNIGGGGL